MNWNLEEKNKKQKLKWIKPRNGALIQFRKKRIRQKIIVPAGRTTGSYCRIFGSFSTVCWHASYHWSRFSKISQVQCGQMSLYESQHHKLFHFDYSLHNQTLENVQSAKYLGITISDNMDGVNTFQKFLPKQLRHLVSFAGIWLLHLGVLRKLHTKLWFGLN